jgi:hypothetical protein
MPAFRTREVAAASGLAAIVALSIAAAILGPPPAENLPPGSSFSHMPDGSAAAYQTLQRLGYTMRRAFDPVASLVGDPPAVLVLAEPGEIPTNSDRRAIQGLAASGATVLLTGCGGAAFLGPGDAVRRNTAAVARTFAPRAASPLTEDVARVTMRADCGAWDAGGGAILFGDERDAAVRVINVGRGAIVWWTGSTPLTNEGISEPGNLELLLNVVARAGSDASAGPVASAGPAGGTILWDEFYHGQRRSLYSYARQTPLPWAAAQLALVLGVAAAMFARRRAPILDRPVEPRASTLEFIDTIAALYARSTTARDAVVTARLRLRRLLSEATGLAASSDDERLARAAAARLRLDAGALSGALAASAGALDERMTARDALPLVRQLQANGRLEERK